ncbi:gamma-glutamylcyclotransferase [Mucilaginibacter sp. RB4R14]|uniref:gamma-glutamylcyclotransferase family protein n=1 Tax=Mucilaginibacter aurantiaciroseus TaxID=2949308 RepID=UPI002090397D|nr:gamma-glutamylcyclotransferase family protein [Mucilaginibacter aurantiaciroseus]MCO5934792.1 gamma-glutamylcyclotransferase [Mucilaginibacter aurantiaciroseus]
MIDLLFVYGTLIQPGNPIAGYLNLNCTYLLRGKIKGILYDIGEYPGLIISDNAQNYVYGHIYKLHHTKQNLFVIDDYEGVGPDQEQPNLYIRKIRSVETADGIVDTWIYLYNLPVDGLPLITSGNYAEFTAQKKSPGN